MLSSEMFLVLVLFNAILFIAGIFGSSRLKDMESAVLVLISSTLSFLIALECFAGITADSGTIINPWFGMFFGALGAVTFIFFALKVVYFVNDLLETDPDFFRKIRG